ncbi:hypothetical protein [Halovibrio sp. HP20-59]|uniref:hypothetical protein n=1 Tax=Halovibrio sp. HP20-59 TaxID=3080275 RepID=UPI002AFDCE9A|nr:hypothetical protein [Halovibrio sp. HP20-59]MEA2118772.1 hypothetical protein [Halovibrio sp. HP20-59]
MTQKRQHIRMPALASPIPGTWHDSRFKVLRFAWHGDNSFYQGFGVGIEWVLLNRMLA